MKVVVWSGKGGVGKSFIVANLLYAENNKWECCDLDPFGDIYDRFTDKSIYIEEDEDIPDLSNEEGDIIFDFKGGKDKRLFSTLEISDLLIIPLVPSLESLSTTLKSLDYISHIKIKKLFVINMVDKDINVVDTIEVINDHLGYDIEYTTIKQSKAYRTAINNGKSIIAMAKRKGIAGSAYRTHSKEIQTLLDKVETYR